MRIVVDLFVGTLIAVAVVTGLVWMVGAPGISYAQDDPATLLEQMSSDDSDVRLLAVIDAGQLKSAPDEVIDRLLELTLDESEFVRLGSIRSLTKIGEPVNVRLEKWMDDDDSLRFTMAMEGVRSMGPLGVKWVPKISERLKSDDFRTKMASLFTLEAIGPAAEPALDRMIELLKDPEFQIQQVACRAIAAMGPVAKRAAPHLAKLVDEDHTVSARTQAIIALGAIGPVEGIDTVGIIRPWLKAFTVTDKERSLHALAKLGPLAIDAKDDVEKLMLDASKSVMPNAAYTYWRITGEKTKTMEVLTSSLADYSFRNTSLIKLGEMGPEAAAATRQIAEYLSNDEPGIRESALYALQRIGPAAGEAIPHVRLVIESDDDLLLRQLAQDVLQAISAEETADK